MRLARLIPEGTKKLLTVYEVHDDVCITVTQAHDYISGVYISTQAYGRHLTTEYTKGIQSQIKYECLHIKYTVISWAKA